MHTLEKNVKPDWSIQSCTFAPRKAKMVLSWNYKQTGITCNKLPLLKFIEFGMLWSPAWLAMNKKQKCFLFPDHQLPENMVLVFGSYDRKGIKANL